MTGGDDGGTGAGEAYVVFGSASGFGTIDGDGRQVLNPTTLAASQGFVIQGDAAVDFAGWSVSSAGDINGDGFDDLIVGAPSGDDGGDAAGEAYVIFGTDQGFGTTVGGRKVIDLTTLSAAQGFTIQGDNAVDRAGISVSSAGDVNGDGFDDLIVGGYLGDDGGSNAGEAYVIFGTDQGFGTAVGGRNVLDLRDLSAAQGFIVQGDVSGDRAGASVSSAGDINGHGFDDLIVGAPAGGDGGVGAGEAYVIFGTDQGFGTTVGGRKVIDLTSLSAAQGFIIEGEKEAAGAGWSVSSAGDINGDGFDDLIVGAPGKSLYGSPGMTHIVFGTDQGFGTADGAARQVVKLDRYSGVVIQQRSDDDYTGWSVSSAGDVNGDGFDDIIVGAANDDQGGAQAGMAYVVFGAANAASFGLIDVTMLAPGRGFAIRGDDEHDGAGWSVSSAGDVNGDGFDDLIVGAPYGSDGAHYAGESYIIYGAAFGASTTPVLTTGTSTAEMFIGGAGNDVLDGNGGADRFRSGSGNDTIMIGDASFKLIDAGLGRADTVTFDGAGFALDLRNFSNGEMTGIEVFDMTTGANSLTLAASDLFHFSTVGNSAFTAAGSHNNVVILGDAGDTLTLINYTSSGATWQLATSDKGLDGSAAGAFDLYNLVDGGNVLASVAVDTDVGVLI